MRFRRLPRLFGKSRGQKRDKKGTTNEKICDTICVSADEAPPCRAKTDFLPHPAGGRRMSSQTINLILTKSRS